MSDLIQQGYIKPIKLLKEVINTVELYPDNSEWDSKCVFCGAEEWRHEHHHGCLYMRIKEYLTENVPETEPENA